MNFLEALRARLGDVGVLSEGLEAFETDWRRRYRGRALAVARPASTDEVAAVVRLCAEHGVAIVPQGGNTGLVGGATPDHSGRQLVLCTSRLQRIRAVDAANLTLTAEAGCVLQALQQAAADAGLLLPLSLAAEGSCTIGGNLATNAGGTQVLRYGNARDLCLGLEVVTAAGDIWHGLSGLRKDNTGYDLRDLFIGSEGTLGIITAATLRLHPAPAAQSTALAACESLDAALRLLTLARSRAGASLTAFELMNANSLALVRKQFPALPQPLPAGPWTVLLELSDAEGEAHAVRLFESLLESALENGAASDAAVAQNQGQARSMWALREHIPLAQSQEGLNIKHDISLPISAIPAFVADCDAALASALPGCRLVTFGHMGDGNLHYNVQAPEGAEAPAFLSAHEPLANALVFDRVAARGGSFSAEHGIGQLKRDELAARKDPVALALMRQIKKALDPQGLMNPDKLI